MSQPDIITFNSLEKVYKTIHFIYKFLIIDKHIYKYINFIKNEKITDNR